MSQSSDASKAIVQNIAARLAELPLPQQLEVSHFVEFLKERLSEETDLRKWAMLASMDSWKLLIEQEEQK